MNKAALAACWLIIITISIAPIISAFAIIRNGTNGNDVLYATDEPDTIYGKGGADRIYGYRGADKLYGGVRSDTIYAGSGNDNVYAWYGNNYVSGGAGKDKIWATGSLEVENYNRLYGYAGADTFTVRNAGATTYGGGGNDYIDAVEDAGYGGFLIYGGAGDDYARVVDNAAKIYGGDGRDKLIATGEAVHRIYGEGDNEWLQIDTDIGSLAYGGLGNDYLLSIFEGSLYGEEGDDILGQKASLQGIICTKARRR